MPQARSVGSVNLAAESWGTPCRVPAPVSDHHHQGQLYVHCQPPHRVPRLEEPGVLDHDHGLLSSGPEAGGYGHALRLPADRHDVKAGIGHDSVVHEASLGVRQPDDVRDLILVELVQNDLWRQAGSLPSLLLVLGLPGAHSPPEGDCRGGLMEGSTSGCSA